jgi:hypothetical protein
MRAVTPTLVKTRAIASGDGCTKVSPELIGHRTLGLLPEDSQVFDNNGHVSRVCGFLTDFRERSVGLVSRRSLGTVAIIARPRGDAIIAGFTEHKWPAAKSRSNVWREPVYQ